MMPIWQLTGRLGNQMFQYAYLYAQARDRLIPDVYVQDEKYFEKYKDEIREIFGAGIGGIDKVSIHVRRGDYVGNPFYIDLTRTEYYQKAMRMFKNKKFLVFSDDIEWCKRQEIFRGCEFSEGNDEITDLNLMASCKGHIIANSSFSYWGAYLGKGRVVAPKAWYGDGINRTFCPKEWIRV
jgi:hypothetical protein